MPRNGSGSARALRIDDRVDMTGLVATRVPDGCSPLWIGPARAEGDDVPIVTHQQVSDDRL